VTVRTQQDALGGFCTSTCETASHSLVGEVEGLHCGVDMVKLQSGCAPLIPAQVALTASFVDKDTFGAPPPTGHALLAAQQAAVVPAPFQSEPSCPVPFTPPLDYYRSRSTIQWCV
jgi:hypothetical protein